LETAAAAKTRIRHCYNRPQTIRRLLSQKPILSREERQTTTNKNFHTQELKFQQLSHTAHTHTQTQQQTNKESPPKEYRSPEQKHITQKAKTRQINFTKHKKKKKKKTNTTTTTTAATLKTLIPERKKNQIKAHQSIKQASKEANFDLRWRKETHSKTQTKCFLYSNLLLFLFHLLHFKSCIFGGPMECFYLFFFAFFYFFGFNPLKI
jgi:hypothetical protein